MTPPTFVGPDLFNPPPHRGWITLTPSVSIVGSYTDNLFLSGRGTETEDFLVGFVPGFTLSMQRPEYQVLAGYNFSAEYYRDQTQLNGVFKRQQAFLDTFYRFSPRLTLTLIDQFILDRDSNVVTSGGVSAGRRDSWRNTLTPSFRYQATPLTALNLRASYSILRFDEGGDARDSDTYRARLGADHQFTQRFLGHAEMEVAYLDAEGEPTVTTYTPRVGLAYQFTPTLRGLIRGGPSLFVREGEEKRITPAVRAELLQLYRFGSLLAGYQRVVTADTIGIRDRQMGFASLRLAPLARGFEFEITPRYTHLDSERERGDRTIDALTVNVRASYQLARNITLFGAYTFFAQRQDREEDIDQNRVFLGLQYSYPINFD